MNINHIILYYIPIIIQLITFKIIYIQIIFIGLFFL